MDDRVLNRYLRLEFSSVGWILIIYYLIMNILVSINQIVVFLMEEARLYMMGLPIHYEDLWEMSSADGLGYFAAFVTGLTILLTWKGMNYWKTTIWSTGSPMTSRQFFRILCVFIGMQLLGSLITEALDFFFRFFHLNITGVYELFDEKQNSFGMFLYAGLLAPISEEILFRGVVQKSLRNFGRNFAIFGSAFTFGMFHGNLMQAPFAFLVGLVLGYVADTYSIGWCMLLHMINNLVLADLIPRVLQIFSEDVSITIQNSVVYLFAVLGAITLFRHKAAISSWMHWQPIDTRCMKCFFTCSGILVFLLLFSSGMIYTLIAFS